MSHYHTDHSANANVFEERTLDRVPTFDADRDQTRKSRKAMEEFLKQAGAQMWIEHDTAAWEKLKKSPQYYD